MIPRTGLKNRGWEHQNRDAQGKLIRKDFHYKIFKNPNETILAVQEAGQKKSSVVWYRILMLAIMGGIYVGFGGTFALTMAGYFELEDNNLTLFFRKLCFALFFPVGLVFILLIGGELLTGNIMYMIVSLMSRRIVISDLLKNWGFVLTGNYAAIMNVCKILGTVLMAAVVYGAGLFSEDPHLSYIHEIAKGKVYSNWGVIFLKSIPANFLVCAAIFISIAAEDVPGKVIGMFLPISTFAAIGFEHSVANMFFIHTAIFYGGEIGYGDWLYRNLLPVLLGNAIGGGLFFGLVYWFLYIAEERHAIDHKCHDLKSRRLEDKQATYVAEEVIDNLQQATLKSGAQLGNCPYGVTMSPRTSYDLGIEMPLERLSDTNT